MSGINNGEMRDISAENDWNSSLLSYDTENRRRRDTRDRQRGADALDHHPALEFCFLCSDRLEEIVVQCPVSFVISLSGDTQPQSQVGTPPKLG